MKIKFCFIFISFLNSLFLKLITNSYQIFHMRVGIIRHKQDPGMDLFFNSSLERIKKTSVVKSLDEMPVLENNDFKSSGKISDKKYREIEQFIKDKRIDVMIIESNLGASGQPFIWKSSFFEEHPRVEFIGFSSYGVKPTYPMPDNLYTGDRNGLKNSFDIVAKKIHTAKARAGKLTDPFKQPSPGDDATDTMDNSTKTTESIDIGDLPDIDGDYLPEVDSTILGIDKIVKDNPAHHNDKDDHSEHHNDGTHTHPGK